LEGDAVEYIEEIETLLEQESDLAKLVAYHRVSGLVDSGNVSPARLVETGQAIEEDIRKFEALLDGNTVALEGGVAA